MKTWIALLRAVNVGGTGKLPMSELRALCADEGFEDAATYIQSGNVVFNSGFGEARVKRTLEAALGPKLAKPVDVLVRSPKELAGVLDRNPFPEAAPNKLLVLFFDRAVRSAALAGLETPGGEQVVASGREVFVHYPDGMGRSKLKLPLKQPATGRNLNTVAKLIDLARRVAPGA